MVNQKLIDYIQSQLKLGTDLLEIKKIVLQNGWSEEDFDQSLHELVIILESKLIPNH